MKIPEKKTVFYRSTCKKVGAPKCNVYSLVEHQNLPQVGGKENTVLSSGIFKEIKEYIAVTIFSIFKI